MRLVLLGPSQRFSGRLGLKCFAMLQCIATYAQHVHAVAGRWPCVCKVINTPRAPPSKPRRIGAWVGRSGLLTQARWAGTAEIPLLPCRLTCLMLNQKTNCPTKFSTRKLAGPLPLLATPAVAATVIAMPGALTWGTPVRLPPRRGIGGRAGL